MPTFASESLFTLMWPRVAILGDKLSVSSKNGRELAWQQKCTNSKQLTLVNACVNLRWVNLPLDECTPKYIVCLLDPPSGEAADDVTKCRPDIEPGAMAGIFVGILNRLLSLLTVLIHSYHCTNSKTHFQP